MLRHALLFLQLDLLTTPCCLPFSSCLSTASVAVCAGFFDITAWLLKLWFFCSFFLPVISQLTVLKINNKTVQEKPFIEPNVAIPREAEDKVIRWPVHEPNEQFVYISVEQVFAPNTANLPCK